MAEQSKNMFDELQDIGRLMRETAQALEVVQTTLVNAVETQKANGEKCREISALVSLANEALARSNVHIARTRELLEGWIPVASDIYRMQQSEEAIAAVQRVAHIVEDAKSRVADAEWMRDALTRIRAEHRIVRNWLAEAVYDEPQSQEAAVVVRRNMDRLESTFESDIECAVTLAPFKDAFAETSQRMNEILSRSMHGDSRSS